MGCYQPTTKTYQNHVQATCLVFPKQSSVAQHSKIDPNARYHHSPERPERPGTLRFGIPVVPADAMLPKPVVPGAKLLPALANDVTRIRGAKLGICFDPEKDL
jgi:hypothetical protein